MNVLTLRAFFIAKESGELPPYLGSTLRGILGHCLRDFACIAPGVRCHLCEHSAGCGYAKYFCSPGNVAGAVNPYVIYTSIRDKTVWRTGDSCVFDITLIGETVHSAGYYLDGLVAMGNRGWGAGRMRFSLEQVINPNSGTLVWSNGKSWLRNVSFSTISSNERKASGALIRFDSPTRVLIQRNLCRKLSFATLVQSLTRRISLLSHAYSNRLLPWDEEKLVAEAQRVRTVEEHWSSVDFKRYSINHDRELSLPAIEGWARYEGDLTPFTPLLDAGTRLHVGKNATHGFGHYQVYYDR
ncbi:CRISPR system precrRNA processing endoribonuclease RAMP protein Cas6 [Paenibacillus doosanensis]|uniref:CRISPR system precrRNA processing endoribonuclease RAMP protein Cas6 n=1 Tax=Paenibacillus doosanensis TaxID=1229154 RepID=UPI0021800D05|nr:CRISPR system precrRNA processing endoribonuclease RAMP protein Cas6 [Paenibacillus doosanensis]MCS7461185.1 CRISPR system precrRNA processing endoribonuclease RAMP protein Cas6 [Paenibacillus doosanensis]